MSNICAGIGRGQMEVLDKHVGLRREMNAFYENLFKDIPAVTVFKADENISFSNYWLSAIEIDNNNEIGVTSEQLRLFLDEANIESRPLWKPMHLQPVFENYPYYGTTVSQRLFENGLCLPSGSNLTNEDRERIKSSVTAFFKNKEL
jgi:dTDP-4-amino-4,6-dideoxygalactose transaminase